MATDDDLHHSPDWPLTLRSLRDFTSRLLQAVHGWPPAALVTPERTGQWSFRDVTAHLGDLELLTAVRLRLILTEEHPSLPGFNGEQFVAVLHQEDDPAELLEAFASLRRSNLALIERLTAVQLERTGLHPEYGLLTVRQIACRLQRHQEAHLRQVERIRDALGMRTSDQPDLHGVVFAHASDSPRREIGPGIRVLDLWRNGARAAMQVEIEGGSVWPGLDHHIPGPEEVYVVNGEFQDGVHAYGPGSFLHYPAGSSHVPQSKSGCTLFVFYPEG